MNNDEFIALVKRMRDMQKQYFRYRDYITLRESKKLEREVDNYIANIEKNNGEQTTASLFD